MAGEEKGNLADAGTAAAAQLEAHVRQLGTMAAQQTMAQQNGTAGAMGGVVQNSMPAIPAPIVAGQHVPQVALPVEGGGSDNHGLRASFDKTRLVNQISDAAATALQNHKEKQQAVKQREYEIIMTAMQGMNSPDPAVKQHNIDLVNHFFDGPEGEKRAKAIQKSMGFDAFDAKAEAKKQADPDHQAIQGAIKTISAGGTAAGQQVPGSVQPTSKDGAPPVTQRSPMQSMSGLNPTAQAFMKNMPMVTGAPTYQMSAAEMGQAARVAAKIVPDADSLLSAQTEIMKLKNAGIIELNRSMTERDIEVVKARSANLIAQGNNANAYSIALLEHQDRVLTRSIQEKDLELKRLEYNDKNAYKRLDIYKEMKDASLDRAKVALTKQNELQNSFNTLLREGKFKDEKNKKIMEDEIASSKDDAANYLATYDQANTNYMNEAGRKGANASPAGRTAGADAAAAYDKSNPAHQQPNGSGKPSATPTPVTAGDISLYPDRPRNFKESEGKHVDIRNISAGKLVP